MLNYAIYSYKDIARNTVDVIKSHFYHFYHGHKNGHI